MVIRQATLLICAAGMLVNCGSKGEGSSGGLKSPIVKRTVSPNSPDQDIESPIRYFLETYLKTPTEGSEDTAVSPIEGINYGLGVAIFGDVAVVSQSDSNISNYFYHTYSVTTSGGTDSAVYVYRRNSVGDWRFEAKLEPSDQAAGCTYNGSSDCMGFGASVATNGEVIIVGAPKKADGAVDNAGGVYVYRYNAGTWALEDSMQFSSTVADDYMGYDVDISSDGARFVAGAPGRNSGQGSVVVYKYASGAWSEETELAEGAAPQLTGRSVAISDDGKVIIAGSPRENSIQGNAYVWRYGSSWSLEQTLEASDEAFSGAFGSCVDISQTTIAISGYPDFISGPGQVYLFEYSNSSWSETSILTASNGEAEDQFGLDLAISGSTLAVAANKEDGGPLSRLSSAGGQSSENPDSQHDSGAAYIFSNISGTWEETAYIKAPNAEINDAFATRVAISNGEVIIGAPLEDGGNDDATDPDDNEVESAGAAYIFRPAH